MSNAHDSVRGIREAVAARTASASDVTRAALARINAANPALNAFTQIFDEFALRQAGAIDALIAAGEPVGPLAGVPVALKDNICLAHGKTTCASRMLENYESPFDATVAARLIEAGAVIVGKTNLDEFAMGSSTEHSCFGPVKNPWDHSRVPGGSSGGSAAAVAAGLVPIALGSDTGGSIRQPAALCGVLGIKPTYGRVSRYGLVAFASSLDQIGPFARSCADAAAVMDVICGIDHRDSTSAEVAVPGFAMDLESPVDGLILGVPRQAYSDANHPAVTASFKAAVDAYVKLGAQIVEIDLPLIDEAIAAYYIVAPAEASSNLARFDGVRYGRRAKLDAGDGLMEMYCRSRSVGFGAEVQRRIMLGTHVLSSGYYDAYYTTALKVRRRLKHDFDAAFRAGCHAVLMPSTPGPAFRLGEKTGDPMAMYLEDVYTVAANLAGLPGLSMPAGFAKVDGKDLPLGVQLIGQPFEEAELLQIAAMFERATEWSGRRPVEV